MGDRAAKKVKFNLKEEKDKTGNSQSGSDDENSEEKNEEASIISDLSLDKVDNPRQRELLLLAKLKIMKEKLTNKNTLIVNLKETLESDEKVKKAMNDKIYDLKSRIENYREEAIKHGLKVNGLDSEDSNDGQNLLDEEEGEDFHEVAEKKRGGYKYMINSSALANEHQNKIFILNNKTCWGRFKHKWHRFLDFFTPFSEDLKHISYRYDRLTQTLFDNVRFIFLLSIGVFIIYLYFLITHILNADFSTGNVFCKFYLPCALFYSRVNESESQAFSITYATWTFFIFYFCVMRVIHMGRMKTNSKLYEREDKPLTKFFFSSWDWSTKTKPNYIENKKRLRATLIDSFSGKDNFPKLNNYTSPCTNWTLRIISWFFSLIILVIYFVLILFAFIIRGMLISKDTNKTTLTMIDTIYEILPTLICAVSHLIFPRLVQSITCMEKWGSQSSYYLARGVKYFIARIWGLAAVYFVNIYFVLLNNSITTLLSFFTYTVSTHSCPGASVLNIAVTSNMTLINKTFYSECAEDDVIINILFIALAEYFFRKISELVWFSFIYCCNGHRRRIGESYKSPYNPVKEAIDIISTVIQLLSVVTFFPYIVAIIPLILWMEFKYQKFKLIKLRSKPIKDSIEDSDLGYQKIILSLSVFMVVVINTLFYIGIYPHLNYMQCYSSTSGNQIVYSDNKRCGPYATLTPVSSTLLLGINSSTILNLFYYVVSSPEPLIIILIVVICSFLYKSDDLQTCKFYVEENEKEMTRLINNLQGKVEDLGEEKKSLVVQKLNRRKSSLIR